MIITITVFNQRPCVHAGRDVAAEVGSISGGSGAAVPGHLIRRLETVATRLVEKYALVGHKDRELVCRGLCQLWLSLAGPGQGDNLSRMVGRKLMIRCAKA